MTAEQQEHPSAREPKMKSIVRGLVGGVLAGSILVGLAWGGYAALRYTRHRLSRALHQPLKRIVLTHSPRWLSAAILDRLAQEAVNFTIFNAKHPEYGSRLRDPLDGGILKIIAQHYMDHQSSGENAWIKGIVYVRRAWLPHQQIIEIDAEYRRPAALLITRGKGCLLSASGVRLPGTYLPVDFERLAWLPWLVHTHVAAVKRGEKISSPAVQAGLELVKLLAPEPWHTQVREIDLSNFGGAVSKTAPEIVLTTRDGHEVLWGMPPGKEGFYEVPASRKLMMLSEVNRLYGSIDAGKAYVDVRGDQVLVPRRDRNQTVVSQEQSAQ
ncbi:MAG: cell division protein FtsQ/DivIB [Phycisphaerae bacterium]